MTSWRLGGPRNTVINRLRPIARPRPARAATRARHTDADANQARTSRYSSQNILGQRVTASGRDAGSRRRGWGWSGGCGRRGRHFFLLAARRSRGVAPKQLLIFYMRNLTLECGIGIGEGIIFCFIFILFHQTLVAIIHRTYIDVHIH